VGVDEYELINKAWKVHLNTYAFYFQQLILRFRFD
jgi:hypothetical protein